MENPLYLGKSHKNTLWETNSLLLNMVIYFVDFPSYKMVDLSRVMWLFTRGYFYGFFPTSMAFPRCFPRLFTPIENSTPHRPEGGGSLGTPRGTRHGAQVKNGVFHGVEATRKCWETTNMGILLGES